MRPRSPLLSFLAPLLALAGSPSLAQEARPQQTLASPDGELLPRTIVADGDVLMSDATQSLRAQRVNATLKRMPSTAPTETSGPGEAAQPAATTEPTTSPATQPTYDTPEMAIECESRPSWTGETPERCSGRNTSSANSVT